MRAAALAACAALASVATAVLEPGVETPVCPSGPFVRLSPETWCPAVFPRQQQPAKARPAPTTTTSTWTGPHACVGAYCVFADETFGRGGVVLVTTKGNAKRVRRLHPDTSGASSDDAAFQAKAIPGKGIGLVAMRKIARGELVMAETPAILVHKQVLEEPSDIYLPSLELAVSKMTPATNSAFMKQGTQGDYPGAFGIMDRMFTNSFQMALAGVGAANQGGFHYGNFPNVSRLNHDCRPNLVFHIDSNLIHRTFAVRDIAPGEELTISYVDQFEPAAQRQARTRSSLGFVCACSHCSLPPNEAAASEARIRRIKQLESDLGEGTAKKSASLAMVEELLGLYAVERLESKVSGAYHLAALTYNRFRSKRESTRQLALLAARALEMERGREAPDVASMEALAEGL